MCIFSKPVEDVSNTKIFSRLEGDRQFLIYEMDYTSNEEMAMILPIPSQSEPTFVNLEDYPDIFKHLHKCFPVERYRGMKSVSLSDEFLGTIKVHSVGSYDASYVNVVEDLLHLDPRFRLPADIIGRLKGVYGENGGYVVFKLKPGKFKAHPMAFKFKTVMPGTIFFPTIHVHNGELPRNERFDHSLYMQLPSGHFLNNESGRKNAWKRAKDEASDHVDIAKSKYLVRKGQVYRRQLKGHFSNEDILFPTSEAMVA